MNQLLLKIQIFLNGNKLYFIIKMENNDSQYYCFNCMFDQKNAALES